jgi:hypothetical protein
MQEAAMHARPSGKPDSDAENNDSKRILAKGQNQSFSADARGSDYSSPRFKAGSFPTIEEGNSNGSKDGTSGMESLANDDRSRSSISNRSDVFDSNGGSREGPQYTPPDYDFEGEMELCKEGRGYRDAGAVAAAEVANSTCQFLLSEMYSQGGSLEFLEQDTEQGRRDNLLEYGWGNTNNLEDMENMFL